VLVGTGRERMVGRRRRKRKERERKGREGRVSARSISFDEERDEHEDEVTYVVKVPGCKGILHP